ncbi:cilia- and flagella-associated protein 52 isoform X2 [Periplaneta americana]
MGFKALVTLWDFEKKQLISKYDHHKVRVESVIFTCDSKYLISLGGRDDSNIIVWNIEKGEALCGALASRGTSGDATVLCRTNLRGLCFLTGGKGTLRAWKVLPDKRQTDAVDVKFGLIKRHIICMVVDDWDTFAFCGTTSGDIIKIKLNYDCDVDILDPITAPVLVGCLGKYVGKKRLAAGEEPARYSQGVTALFLWPDDMEGRIIVGGGDGTIELVKELNTVSLPEQNTLHKVKMPSLPKLITLKSTTVDAGPTSLQLLNNTIYVGTMLSEIFTIDFDTFEVRLHITCHKNAIYDIAFPYEYSDVFATCSKDDIRVWNTETSLELLRITVHNFTCTGIMFSSDGKSIVSGWNDGEIRAFTPQTGRLIYEIHNAHNKGVTAIAITECGQYIVSGGGEGQVRVWEIRPTYQKLQGILQEHKGPVSCIRIASSNTEAVSASSDGTCVIWDIVRMTRKHSLFANTQFMGVCYHPSGVQVVTTGTDRKIGYWEVYDGTLIREMEGSTSSGLNAIDMTRDGSYMLTGGNDQYVKIWDYNIGNPTHIGIGHAGVVTAVRFSPNNEYIISVSSDGGIFRWRSPYVTQPLKESQQSARCSSRSTRSTCSEREEEWKQMAKEEEEENVEKLSTSARSSSSNGSKEGSKKNAEETEKQICICEEEDVPSESKKITKDTSKSDGTPKSGASKSDNTQKRNGTPKSGSTPKSSGTSKSGVKPKSNGTPKSGGSPKNILTPKSNGTPKNNAVTPKSKTTTPKDQGDIFTDQKCNCVPENNISTTKSGTRTSKSKSSHGSGEN